MNWQNEIEKFTSLKALIYYGGQRVLPPDTKIIITSYGVMKKEAETTFKDINFDVFILDEAQSLKNVRSQGAIQARKIKATFRICLTGTPVENDLAEFYNILDLSVPGIWGDSTFVKTRSVNKSRLMAKKLARPFILRRTKSQVLKDLPPKNENNIYLRFTEEEEDRYQHTRKRIRSSIEEATSIRKYGTILNGLLELRQLCLWQNRHHSSTKIRFLMENVEQLIEEGHQTIIYSQFTRYLDIIQKNIQEKGWSFSRLDGSMPLKKRNEQVEKFQSGDNRIFLISLKAGGLGLNLTAASYIFLMDPWWNPAVEAQAIDRAHRIGQENHLTVYRLIIKDSVEEKVLLLQQMKRELFQDLLAEDDERYFSGRLTMDDFQQLLS